MVASGADAQADLFSYCLRMGDNALVLGQRLGEWVRNAPSVELDIAMANFALDYIGQARMWLSYAGEVEGRGRSEDDLAYFRDAWDFHNILLVELPNGDFGRTMLRLFFYSAYAQQLYAALEQSGDAHIAAIAAKAAKEVAYHVTHAGEWVVRLGDGTTESHCRIQQALQEIWPYTGEMFAPDELDARVAETGAGADPAGLRAGWEASVKDVLARATLQRPDDDWEPVGGKAGRHSEHLGPLLAEMQSVQRAYPGCQW